MKKKLILPLIASLALAACSSDNDTGNPTAGTLTPQTTTETAETTTSKPSEAAIGEPTNIAQLPDNEVNMTVTDIQLGGDCKYGTPDFSLVEGGGVTPPDMQLLQIWADVENVKLDNPETANDFIWLEEPKVVDSAGYTSSPVLETACKGSTDNHQDWADNVYIGEKKRLYRSWAVPMNVEQVKLYGMTFAVEQ